MAGIDDWKCGLACALFAISVPAAAAGHDGAYGASLGEIYSAVQRVLALREACDRALPAQAKANGKAYGAWRARHQALLRELDTRLTLMIRGASEDEAKFVRNIGKYEGAIRKERRDYRDQFAAQPREDVERLCREYPEYLGGADADLGREYAEALRVLRQRQLPK